MKSFVCDLCNGTKFTKFGGCFVCEQCGVQYSVDEMRKLMRDIPNESVSAPSPARQEPTPDVDRVPQPIVTVEKAPPVNEPVIAPPDPTPHPASNKPHQDNKADKLAKEKKKKKIKIIILSAIAALVLGFFVFALILACNPKSTVGNTLLILSGILELLIAVILYKIMIHIERYRCPICAEKRVHHRHFVRTSEVDKDFANQGGRTFKTIYTHHYHDTYVCPNCGETRHEQVTKGGGEYTELGSGVIKDTRKPPKEF